MSLFGKIKLDKPEAEIKQDIALIVERENFEIETKKLVAAHEIEKNNLVAEHAIQIRDLEAKLANEVPAEVQKHKDNAIRLEKELAVATTRIEMLEKLIAIDSDVVDVKNLINSLIEKLPSINVSSLNLSVPEK